MIVDLFLNTNCQYFNEYYIFHQLFHWWYHPEERCTFPACTGCAPPP